MFKKRIPILLSLLLPLLAAVALMNALYSPAAHAAPMKDADPSRTRGGNSIIDDTTTGYTFKTGNSTVASPSAGSIAVNTTTDEFGTGAGCSLREAIQSANQDSNFDNCTRTGAAPYIVNVPTGTYTLTITGMDENANASGDLDILVDMTLSGEGANAVIVDGNATDRVFEVHSGNVIFDSLSIVNGYGITTTAIAKDGITAVSQADSSRNGNALTPSITHGAIISSNGGGIMIQDGAAVIVSNSAVSHNHSDELYGGGGIFNAGVLTVSNSIMISNTAVSDGGAITSFGTVYIYASTIDDNRGDWSSGGLYAVGSAMIVDSTLSNNHSGRWGGAITADDAVPLTIVNSTLSGNTAAIGAGAISDDCDVPAIITIENSTIVNNGTPTTWSGGGMDMCTSTATFKNSILAGNYNGDGLSNFVGTTVSQGYNLESGTDAVFTATGDLQNTDPLILPLADNGGATWTHALGDDSPAINHIPDGVNGCGTTYTTDQRDKPRPVGNGCDIGSYEKQVYTIFLPTILK